MSVSRVAKVAIKLPKRIERGPTDILKALASTVRYDPKTPYYDIKDDPHLLPSRQQNSNTFLLAKLSGIKAARFVFDKHPELFFRDDAEPKIDAYLPEDKYDPSMEFELADFVRSLYKLELENSIVAYEALEKNQVFIDDKILGDLLEFVCYTNETPFKPKLQSESEYFVWNEVAERISWKENGLASRLFAKLKSKLDPSRAYTAIIAGMVAHHQPEEAIKLFSDFKTAHPDKSLHVQAYSALLSAQSQVSQVVETNLKSFHSLIDHMAQHRVKPDLTFFNTILESPYDHFERQHVSSSLKLVNDMLHMGINPSLYTFYCLMHIMSKSRQSPENEKKIDIILEDIRTNSKDIMKITDPRDIDFLYLTMKSVVMKNENLKQGYTLYEIFKNNRSMFRRSRSNVLFINWLFEMIAKFDGLDNILKFYEAEKWLGMRPNSNTYEALADALETYRASDEIVEDFISDLTRFRVILPLKNDRYLKKFKSYAAAIESFENSKEQKFTRDRRSTEMSE